MIDLITISEKFRIPAIDALFGNEALIDHTVDANPDHEDLLMESFRLADQIQRGHLLRSLAAYAENFGGPPPQPTDPEPYFRLSDNFAVLAEKALDSEQRRQLVLAAGGPSREVSDAFAAKGCAGLARAFLPE